MAIDARPVSSRGKRCKEPDCAWSSTSAMGLSTWCANWHKRISQVWRRSATPALLYAASGKSGGLIVEEEVAAMGQRIVIIGAGPTGLGAAYRLQELGYTDWAIYERNPYIGGLAESFQDEAGFRFGYGGVRQSL